MTNEIALLPTIREAPHDTSRRLIYADWLEENNKADEAGLVRLHVRMAEVAETTPALEEFFPEEMEARGRCENLWLSEYENALGDGIVAVSVARSWWRIRKCWNDNIPGLTERLNHGVPLEIIAEFEEQLRQSLPPAVVSSLRIHNGGKEDNMLFFLAADFIPLQQTISEWRFWLGFREGMEDLDEDCTSFPEQAIQLRYACEGWIPLIDDEASNYIGVDLAPGLKGRFGQVILFGRDERQKCVLASTLGSFLHIFAGILEAVKLKQVKIVERDGLFGEHSDLEGYDTSLFAPPDCTFTHPYSVLRFMAERGMLYDIDS